jgi:hypothetical protein
MFVRMIKTRRCRAIRHVAPVRERMCRILTGRNMRKEIWKLKLRNMKTAEEYHLLGYNAV